MKKRTTSAREPRQDSRPGPTGLEGLGGGSPQVSSGTRVFYFLLWSEHFKGSLKKEKEVSRVFLLGLFNWPRWEFGNPSQLAPFCTHAA
jgi:hypothetical protein